MHTIPANFSISPRRKLVRFISLLIGIILVSAGFLQSLNSRGERTLWIIDNSLSMAVTDVHTASGVMVSRFDFAKQLIIQNSEHIGGEQGILSAAQNARLELPMTTDRDIFIEVVNGVNLLSYGGGSMVSSPLELIRLVYGTTPDLHIIWITDGEFSDSGATFSGFTMIPSMTFVGVGSRVGGPILEGYNSDGYPRYKESGGKKVNSIRDDTKLGSIASSLDTQIIFFDSDTDTKIPIKKNMDVDYQYLWIMALGVFFILSGLMYPRYSYFLK